MDQKRLRIERIIICDAEIAVLIFNGTASLAHS